MEYNIQKDTHQYQKSKNEIMDFLHHVFSKLMGNSTPKVAFISQGREGEVVYQEGFKEIRFYMEFGGTDVVFYLSIPSVAKWEKSTGFSLNKRDEILSFVATQTQKYQAPSSDFKIEGNAILFTKKNSQ